MAMNRTNPAVLFGGTWEQIKDRFLFADGTIGESVEIGYTNGSMYIDETQLPKHTHTFTGVTATDSLQFRNTSNGNVVELYGKKGIYSLSGDSGQTSTYGITGEASSNTWDVVSWTYTPEGTLSETGLGEEFLPPYITVYAWYRTA